MSWNGSDQTPHPASPDSLPRGRGVSPRHKKANPSTVHLFPRPVFYLILLVVSLGGVAIYFIFFGRDGARPSPAPTARHNSQIVTVAPQITTNAPAVPKKPVDPREDYDHTKMYRDERGILRWNTGCRAFDPTRPRMKPRVLGAGGKRHFRYESENEIAAFLESTAGERRLHTPDYDDPSFLEDFEKSLREPTPIKEDDPGNVKSLKRAVAEVKADLAKRVANGEKISDIFLEANRELDRLARYKDDLEQQLGDIIREGDGKFTDNDVLDVVTAANKMLEENGINPVQPDEFVRGNVRLAAEKLGATREEIEDAEQAAIDRLDKLEKKTWAREAEGKKEEVLK